jgi:glycosyltransferase involved in cell wall biosynthesis
METCPVSLANLLQGWFRRSDVSIFHVFAPPPTGGGHQFMRALWNELEGRGLKIENNGISRTARACLFNSFNFDFKRLRRSRRPGCRMVHRVDGPLAVYRGCDDGTDKQIHEINREFANATIFQSQFSLAKHRELGFDFVDPVVIPNAADPAIFQPRGRIPFSPDRKVRLVSVSWSDNVNKGARIYKWLDEHLDWNRYEYTFVGRSPEVFRRIAMHQPVASAPLSDLLRAHDIYVTASKNDPCSNSLLEALACGLPAIYLDSGGHPEIVGRAGLAFSSPEEIPDLLTRMAENYGLYQKGISIPSIASVAASYLAVMRVSAEPQERTNC